MSKKGGRKPQMSDVTGPSVSFSLVLFILHQSAIVDRTNRKPRKMPFFFLCTCSRFPAFFTLPVSTFVIYIYTCTHDSMFFRYITMYETAESISIVISSLSYTIPRWPLSLFLLSRTRVLLFRPQLKVEWYERKMPCTHATTRRQGGMIFLSFFSSGKWICFWRTLGTHDTSGGSHRIVPKKINSVVAWPVCEPERLGFSCRRKDNSIIRRTFLTSTPVVKRFCSQGLPGLVMYVTQLSPEPSLCTLVLVRCYGRL